VLPWTVFRVHFGWTSNRTDVNLHPQRTAKTGVRQRVMEQHWKAIIEAIGEDPNREGLLKTPERAAKAFEFLTRGYRQDVNELVNNAIFTSNTDEMVIVRNIELYSMCEHHMLPFIGKAHVAYLPQGKVIGLSKIARIVDLFARRLQIQEVLTKQIADCVHTAIGAKGVGVVIEAKHMCMMMRGVEKQNSVMTTSCMLGSFRTQLQTREEFLRLIRD
jgi:GTP cyclohydrolase IA